jgi:cytochrome P450
MSHLPTFVDKTRIFVDRLDALAESGEEFELEVLCTAVTFDVIGKVALGIDLNAQSPDPAQVHPIVKAFSNLAPYFDFEQMYRSFFSPMAWFQKYLASKQLEKSVIDVIYEKWNAAHQEKEEKGAKSKDLDKSVLSLALRDMPVLDSKMAYAASSQLRAFLFAGHDTTSTLLQWAIYSLSINDAAQKEFLAELDRVFGTLDPMEALSSADGANYISELTFTSAIIKETLRLYPPASSARRTPKGTGLMLRLDDDSEILADEYVIYISHFAIHRDPAAFGPDAESWRPDRWIGNVETSADGTNGGDMDSEESGNRLLNEIPASAWRPFERGPRNCIGQELANLEARVILACIGRRFIFEKVGLGGENGEKLVNVSDPLFSDILTF